MDDNTGTLTSHYNTNSTFHHHQSNHHAATSTMTPRRVKRHNRHRSSGRSTRHQPSHPTPETNFANNYSASNPALNAPAVAANTAVGSVAGLGVTNAVSSVPSISGNLASNRPHGRSSQRRRSGDRQSGRNNRRVPQYVNPVTQLMDDSTSSSTDSQKVVGPAAVGMGVGGRLGHSNPMYVHSRPGSIHSLGSAATVAVSDPVPERPPSVHSSYSNYHGVRASLATNGTNSNIINAGAAGLPLATGLLFGRALPNQVGKGLRGSQNSILGEQRRTALTNSEIRVPHVAASNISLANAASSISITNAAGNNLVATAASSSLRGSTDSNLQAVAAINNSEHLSSVASGGGNLSTVAAVSSSVGGQYSGQLPPTSVTSVSNVSPSSIVSSSHNTMNSSYNNNNCNNVPYHLLPPHLQKQQLQLQQQQKQLLLQQQKQQQQKQLLQQSSTHQYHHLNHDTGKFQPSHLASQPLSMSPSPLGSHVGQRSPSVNSNGSYTTSGQYGYSRPLAAGHLTNQHGNFSNQQSNGSHFSANSNIRHHGNVNQLSGNGSQYRSASPPYSSPLYSACPTDEERPPPYNT